MKRRAAQRGSNLVETAFTLIIFMTVVLATFEFGRALLLYHTLTNAAREGARYSVAPFQGTETLPTDVSTHVQTFLTAANITNATIAVNQTFAGTVNGTPTVFTQVNVSAPFTFIFFNWQITLNTSAVMRNETN